MLKILFVSLAMPFPPTNGQRLRNWALLRGLVEEGNEITLVSFAEPHEDSGSLEQLRMLCSGIECVPLPLTAAGGGRKYWSRLRTLVSPLPHGVWRFQSEAMASEVRRRLERESYDLILCDDIYNLKNVPLDTAVPVLLNKHDLTHVILRRYLQYARNPFTCLYGWIEYWKLRRWEAKACSSTEGVLACSNVDRSVVSSLCPKARVQVVPNVVDTEHYTPRREDDGRTLLYFGSMDWTPNLDAVDYFISDIYPRIRVQCPEARFVVAGHSPPKTFLRRFADVPGVEFTGRVPDMRPLIARAAVCVVPLRIGSGTRLKILEAAAMGKAIVSTAIGAEGLDFIDGREILLADAPEGLARATADLLGDGSRRRELGQAARLRAENQYSLHALRIAVRDALAVFEPNSPAADLRLAAKGAAAVACSGRGPRGSAACCATGAPTHDHTPTRPPGHSSTAGKRLTPGCC